MASSSKPKRIYDVFLSFRGTNIRNNFLGHLYKALVQNGINTFRDSEKLRKGDQISPVLMKAIEESCIAIVIFSEDYASSQWCLEEVVKIMECKEQKDLSVLPVFYKVDPREVRGGRESYQKALAKHESKFGKDSEKVKRWKKALFDAGTLSGWHLNDGDESELIQEIVKEISTYLARTPLHVAKHPVGINSRVVKLKSMLNLESDDGVLMVGLWGQGGIGKTSLAKALYNAMFRQFEGSCFLADVQETSKGSRGLVTLQEILLKDILVLQQKLEVSNVAEGINIIQHRLGCKKVLLILDDVDDLRQLNALAGEGKWFGNGSRIIVTTRDKHLLTCHGIYQDHVYEVKALHDSQACELLSKHAFQMHQIKTDLVDSALNYCKGLPLALEVLGSLLCGATEDVWESTLMKLSRIPDKTINNVLKVSYDGLDENEKEIFLHIACFFKGWAREYTKKVLDSCDLQTAVGFEILLKRSLIRIESKILKMHDLIQLMGMDIVNKKHRYDPGRRSRLWLYDDVVDVLSSDMGDCAIKAIVLELPELIEMCIGTDALTKMRRLRLLILRNVHNSFQGPICLPNELRWFEWPGCAPIPTFSSGPKKLVGLDISKSSITIVPKQFKDFLHMKYINFSECESLVSMPDLSCIPNLEKLNLENCKYLVEAHESIAYHDKLQVLTLKGCSELSVFPNVLRSKNLQSLDLENCTKLERFPDIPTKLEGLKKLVLQGTAIKELPASIENLISLEIMHAGDCKNLVSLPSSIYNLQNIENLDLQGCTKLIGFPKYENSTDPHMKTGLSKLSILNLAECNLSEVEFLENLSCFPFLSQLILNGNNIPSLPTSINRRDSLTNLHISYCHQLRETPELPPFLDTFRAINCESLQKIGDFTPPHDFARRVLTMDHIFSRDQSHPRFIALLPGEEMPEWIIPVEEDFVSWMVSKDLHDKFLGFAFCFVFNNGEQKEEHSISVRRDINGQPKRSQSHLLYPLDLDHVLFEYMTPLQQWGVVDFSQIDGCHVQFSLTISCKILKKWGFRIICKPLEDDLKVEIRDNQLIDPVFLYEFGHDSTDPEAMSSHMHEDSSIEIDLPKDLQNCQMSTKEHSQIVSKRNHELILTQGMHVKTLSTSNSIGGAKNRGVGLQLLLPE